MLADARDGGGGMGGRLSSRLAVKSQRDFGEQGCKRIEPLA